MLSPDGLMVRLLGRQVAGDLVRAEVSGREPKRVLLEHNPESHPVTVGDLVLNDLPGPVRGDAGCLGYGVNPDFSVFHNCTPCQYCDATQ